MLAGLYIATQPTTQAPLPACRQPSIALAYRLTLALASTQVLRTINALYTRLDRVILQEFPRCVSGEVIQDQASEYLPSRICVPFSACLQTTPFHNPHPREWFILSFLSRSPGP